MNKKTASPYLTAIAVFIWLIVIVMIMMLFSLFDNQTNNIDSLGTKLHGNFMSYENKVYVSVPSNGYYPIAEADVNTFEEVSDKILDRQVGKDKNHVYCGNKIMPNLNPSQTKAIGNSYYSDGNITYFCSTFSEINTELSWWQEVQQSLKYKYLQGDKPQTYFYAMKALPLSSTAYQPLKNIDRFAPVITNNTLTFYRGNVMPDANPYNLYQINEIYADGDIRKNKWYFADGHYVYYHNLKLPLQDNGQLYSFYVGKLFDEIYLVNPQDGTIYLKDFVFDKKNAPYTLVSKYGSHVNQTLFLSKNGVFFYDIKLNKLKRAGDNPFINADFKEIAPLVFSNGKKTLFIEASERWYRSKNSGGLISLSTHIYELTENLSGQWRFVGKVRNNYGSVWQNGDDYYYFDELGDTQLIKDTIYKTQNTETKDLLLNPNEQLGTKTIRNLIYKEQLINVKRQEVLEAKTKYKN